MRTVLSVEQALSMSYATLRLVHEGFRVIRMEPTPVPGRSSRGDPNRFIGRQVAGLDRHSYFVAPNVGKEAIAVDLKRPEGRALVGRIIEELGVEVFCTNTLPARLCGFGIDYETLRQARRDLVWCSISAMGTAHPQVPGYDPVLQALCGYMDLTGDADGPPLQCGLPFTDLKAGDEAFTQIILALWRGGGRCIDISMARIAVSWLQTFLPMLDMGSAPAELRRSGNEHRQFIPVNAYPSADGYIYLAIGSDAQWARFVASTMFAALCQERLGSNEGRRANRVWLHGAIGEITRQNSSAKIAAALALAGIPHAPITAIEQVALLPFIEPHLLRTVAPDGREVRLPPAAVDTDHLAGARNELPFAPAYGEHTDAVLAEAGLGQDEIANLRAEGVVA